MRKRDVQVTEHVKHPAIPGHPTGGLPCVSTRSTVRPPARSAGEGQRTTDVSQPLSGL